ncbi:MAG TPA: hypothetical protein P5567_07960 [Kiritimatiellia bacterium]|nr:hypothetical protein [Kiritimatiellia bacterium]HRZ12374.1 hypothetical protein [Kiritimatiellia bacterium]HSA17868.1 hypothetical protein [Kiritimatiellia bacterium]
MNRATCLFLAGCLALSAGLFTARAAIPETPSGALMANYLRYLLLDQVETQGADVIAQAPAADQAGLRAALDRWTGALQQTIRGDLEARLGDNARQQFEDFIDAFSRAEQAQDMAYLENLGRETGWPGPVSAYEDFRRWGVESWLASDMQGGVDLLSEMTARAQPAAAPPPRKSNPLRDAEAAPAAVEYEEPESGAPLQSFSSLREERRQKALEQAQAGMQQVASEREAWEQEYASDVAAKAQAEAEAMKKQAERLAATDQEVLEQDKNSLKTKLIGVLAGGVEAGVGGFTGAVGSRLADEAVNEIFK